ncbi:MAG: class I SAM-dependent methyltransferase [bacterium]
MPYAFHSDAAAKWQQQYLTTKNHILPFILKHHRLPANGTVLEIGSGEGGVLKAFAEHGFKGVGIELSQARIEHAKNLFKDDEAGGLITFLAGDIHDTEKFAQFKGQMDLIVLKDAIEHIPDQERILAVLHQFLRKGGAVFLAFPPWHNPFGGHQQLAGSLLKFLPWFHILPKPIYRGILNLFGETDVQIGVLMEIYDTRLSTRKLERLLSKTCWQIKKREFFLFNPIYEVKFGIKGRRQFRFLSRIPILRDFLSTGVYYLIEEATSAA